MGPESKASTALPQPRTDVPIQSGPKMTVDSPPLYAIEHETAGATAAEAVAGRRVTRPSPFQFGGRMDVQTLRWIEADHAQP
jgi:hypothetical protein